MFASASSTTQLPEVAPVISSALMMSTPEEMSVESVREKRASAILCTTSPMRIGILSLKRSQTCRPRSVRFKRRNAKIIAPIAGKMTNHQWRSAFDICITIWVGFGSSPSSSSKTFTKTGMMKRSMNVSTSARERDHDRRVDHRALDPSLDLRLLLDLDGDAVEHGVERSRRLAGLDHRDEQPVEDLRVPRERLREDDAALDLGADVGDHLGQVLVVRLLLERRRAPRRR